MEISHDKLKEQLSKFYQIGYRTGYKTACRCLEDMEAKDIPKEDEKFKAFIGECIDKLLANYNSYPCIKHLLPEDLKND